MYDRFWNAGFKKWHQRNLRSLRRFGGSFKVDKIAGCAYVDCSCMDLQIV